MLKHKTRRLLTFAIAFLSISCSYAQDGRVRSRCVVARTGEVVCPKHVNADIALDFSKNPVCGKGQCVKDYGGALVCAKVISGFAGNGIQGKPFCQGGCESASSQNCQVLGIY